MNQFLIFIFGASASGKSGIAHTLAKDFGICVVNSDSRQLYKDIPILTACPESYKMQEARYALYQILPPHERPDVLWWANQVKKLIATGESMIVVGGSGFYLNILLEGISPIPDIPPTYKAYCEELRRAKGVNFLAEQMFKRGASISFSDKYRVVRRYQVLTYTGKPIEWWQKQPRAGGIIKQFPDVPRLILCPMWKRKELYRRADLRCRTMMKSGLMGEIEKIADVAASPTFRSSIGMDILIDLHRGKIELEQAMELFQRKVRQYIKRQLTWLNNKINHDYTPIYPESMISLSSLVRKKLEVKCLIN